MRVVCNGYSVKSIDGPTITFKSVAGLDGIRVGATICFLPDCTSPHQRAGHLGVTAIDHETASLKCDAAILAAIPSATTDDYVAVIHNDALEDDHAALTAYLLSAVRRRDWHAVSDAANDLRVLESSRR